MHFLQPLSTKIKQHGQKRITQTARTSFGKIN